MGIGFIQRDENHEADPGGMASERRRAEQVIEELVNMMIDACCEALLRQVRRYAEQLECLDPLNHNAEQEVGNVVLTLSYDASRQERLDDPKLTDREWFKLDDFYPALISANRWSGKTGGGVGEGPLYSIPVLEESYILAYRTIT